MSPEAHCPVLQGSLLETVGVWGPEKGGESESWKEGGDLPWNGNDQRVRSRNVS